MIKQKKPNVNRGVKLMPNHYHYSSQVHRYYDSMVHGTAFADGKGWYTPSNNRAEQNRKLEEKRREALKKKRKEN